MLKGGQTISKINFTRVRVNNKIKAPKVRLIDPEGSQVGVITIQEAKQKADEFNLDLVEVVPDAKPPVCKIMDFGKF
ncbi:MAG: translation initiation factor IF-3, partial [bacterium]